MKLHKPSKSPQDFYLSSWADRPKPFHKQASQIPNHYKDRISARQFAAKFTNLGIGRFRALVVTYKYFNI